MDLQQFGPLQKNLPQVATGWLLLSHGVFLAASISCSSMAVNQIDIFPTHTNLQSVSVGWSCLSIFFALFTSFMLYRTWVANRQFPNAVFNQTDFFIFGVLIAFVLLQSIWTLIVVSQF
jgi:hypothetical protein